MAKKIWELFPKCVYKFRSQRGQEPKGKIILPLTEDVFFQALASNMIILQQNFSFREGGMNYINNLVIYQGKDDKYGLLITGWCTCQNCKCPIKDSTGGTQLQQLADFYTDSIIWFDSFVQLQEAAPRYTKIKEFLKTINSSIIT